MKTLQHYAENYNKMTHHGKLRGQSFVQAL